MMINLYKRNKPSKGLLSHTIKIRKGKSGIIFWKKPSLLSMLASISAVIFLIFTIFVLSVRFFPTVIYRVFPGISGSLAQILSRPPTSFGDLLSSSGNKEAELYQPPLDPKLSDDNILLIPKIGVETKILEESFENYEIALRRGVWRVPDYGTPFQRKQPTILVAHRFGYLEWTNQFRRQNSFFNLPKLEPGDHLQIIWNKRKYEYEIYSGKESEEITDYRADLVLYTCKFLESPFRIFRYAKLVQPTD